MDRYQQFKPYFLELVDGFTNVTVIPPPSAVAPNRAPHAAILHHITPSSFGCRPDEYRIFGPPAVDERVQFCAFRDLETAQRFAHAVGETVVAFSRTSPRCCGAPSP